MVDIIIFDWKRTLYDPDRKVLVLGVAELLEFIKSKNIPMVLIGKGDQDMKQEVKRLGVEKYFQKIVFVKGDKDLVFKKFINEINLLLRNKNPKNTVVIGDRIGSELKIGKKLGAVTIWIKQGKFANELPEDSVQEPDHIVINLYDLVILLKTHSFTPSSGIRCPI